MDTRRAGVQAHPSPLPQAGEGAMATSREFALPRPLAGEGWGEGAELPARPAAHAVPLGVVACRNLVSALPDTIAIVRPGDATLAALLRGAGARVLACAEAASGMGHSIACAIAATRDADGWVIALADMPWVRASTIAAIAEALRRGAPVVAPRCNGRRGNPVGFAAAYRDALAGLAGDRGARDLIAAAGPDMRIVDVDDEGVLRDVDVSADL
jgi:molybdenum cofactor cytidylyltransferase